MKLRHILLTLIALAAVSARAAAPTCLPMSDPWLYVPAQSIATAEMSAFAPEVNAAPADGEVKIVPKGRNKVEVRGAEDHVLEVYNIAGVRIDLISITSPAQEITLDYPCGIYILRVGTVARRVNVL